MEGVCFSGKAWPSQQEAQKPGNLQSTSKYQNSTFEVAILVISHVWSYTFAAESMVIRPFFLQIHSKSWSGFIHLVSYLDIETYLCYIYVISPIYIYILYIYMVLYISPSRHRRFEQTRSKDSVAHSSEPHRHRR